jgi:hypothetical protein
MLRRWLALLALAAVARQGASSLVARRRPLAAVLRGGAAPDVGAGSWQASPGGPTQQTPTHSQGQQRPPPPKPPPRPPQHEQPGTPQQRPTPPRPQQQAPTTTRQPTARPASPEPERPTRSSPGAIQPGPGVDFAALERVSGVRLSWHLWPHPAGADALGAPLGILFSPMAHVDGIQTLKREPTCCSACGAALNPFAQIDTLARRWRCPLCASFSPFDAHLSSVTAPPTELSPEHSTIQYELGARDDTPAAVLLALDCSVRPEEMAHLERTVTEWLQGLPPDTPVGLVRPSSPFLISRYLIHTSLVQAQGGAGWSFRGSGTLSHSFSHTLLTQAPHSSPPPPPFAPPLNPSNPPSPARPAPYSPGDIRVDSGWVFVFDKCPVSCAPFGVFGATIPLKTQPWSTHGEASEIHELKFPSRARIWHPPHTLAELPLFPLPVYRRRSSLPLPPPPSQVTYGEAVEIHELGCTSRARIWHLPHPLAELPLPSFKRLLRLASEGDASTNSAADNAPPQGQQQCPQAYTGMGPGGQQAPQPYPGMGPGGYSGMQHGMYPPPQAGGGFGAYPQQPGGVTGPGAAGQGGVTPSGFSGRGGQGGVTPPGGFSGQGGMPPPGGVPPPGYGGRPGYGGPMGATPGAPSWFGNPTSGPPAGIFPPPAAGFGAPQPGASWQTSPGGAPHASLEEELHGNAARFFIPAADVDVAAALRARASAYLPRKTHPQATSQPPEQQPLFENAGGGAAGYGSYTAGGPGAFGGGGWPGGGVAGPRPGSIAARAAAAAAAEADEAKETEAAVGQPGKRAGRCTGSAMAAAVSLLASCQPDGAARLVTFCGGPSVGGSGAIVEADTVSAVRSHTELQAGSARAREAAAHYDRVAREAAARGHGVDVVAASLEETGLYEMRALVQRTGGVALQAESFEDETILRSLERLHGVSGPADAALGFGAKMELIAGRDCAAVQHVGGGAAGADGAAGEGGAEMVVQECGGARSFSWEGGCLSPHTCIGLTLTPAKPGGGAADMAAMRDSQLLQLSAKYTTAGGRRVQRVTTLRLPRLQRSWDPKQLLPALDQVRGVGKGTGEDLSLPSNQRGIHRTPFSSPSLNPQHTRGQDATHPEFAMAAGQARIVKPHSRTRRGRRPSEPRQPFSNGVPQREISSKMIVRLAVIGRPSVQKEPECKRLIQSLAARCHVHRRTRARFLPPRLSLRNPPMRTNSDFPRPALRRRKRLARC